MAKWYYLVDGQEVGPIDPADLKRLADADRIKPHDKIRRDGMAEWYQAKQVKGLFPGGQVNAAPSSSVATAIASPTTDTVAVPQRAAKTEPHGQPPPISQNSETRQAGLPFQKITSKKPFHLLGPALLAGGVIVLLTVGFAVGGLIFARGPIEATEADAAHNASALQNADASLREANDTIQNLQKDVANSGKKLKLFEAERAKQLIKDAADVERERRIAIGTYIVLKRSRDLRVAMGSLDDRSQARVKPLMDKMEAEEKLTWAEYEWMKKSSNNNLPYEFALMADLATVPELTRRLASVATKVTGRDASPEADVEFAEKLKAAAERDYFVLIYENDAAPIFESKD